MAKQYRKKPVVIEARQWDGTAEGATPIIGWVLDGGGTARYHDAEPPRMHSVHCRCDGRGMVPGSGSSIRCPETEPKGPGLPPTVHIMTLEGVMLGRPQDWFIKGVQGEFYPCKPDIFDATYEPADAAGLSDAETIADLRRRLEDASVNSIVARNPGIDEDEVRRSLHGITV